MQTHLKFDYLEFPAADFDAAQSFYQAIFGWEFFDYGPEYRSFSDGKLDGGFYKSDHSSTPASGSVLVIFYSETLEDTYAAVTANGGAIVKEIFDFPGGRRFHFADPNGNELAVWSDK